MRIRSIKPQFWNHPVMGRLNSDLQALALGLTNYADDEGYFVADPKLINAALRPLKPSRYIEKWLADLSRVGWIELRSHPEMGQLGFVVNLVKHNRTERPQPSTLKAYWISSSKFTDSVIDHRSITAGREGKGREGKGSLSAATLKAIDEPELPGMPMPDPLPALPRKKSRQQQLFDKFQENRKDVLELTLEIPFVPDEEHGPAFINVAISKVLAACNDRDEVVIDLFELFWTDPWAAGLTPPFPFKAFASDKIWPRLLKDMRDAIQSQKANAH